MESQRDIARMSAQNYPEMGGSFQSFKYKMKPRMLVVSLDAARVSILSVMTLVLQGCASKNFVRPEGGGDAISHERINEIVSGKNVVVVSTNEKMRVCYGVQIRLEYASWTDPLNGKPDSMLTSEISKILIGNHLLSATISGLGGAALGAVGGFVFRALTDFRGKGPSSYGQFVVESAVIGGLSGAILGLVVAPWDEYVFK